MTPSTAISVVRCALQLACFAAIAFSHVANLHAIEVSTGDEVIERLMELGLEAAEPAPDRTDGTGPYRTLVLRGGTLIDGTGAPPLGPTDIIVEYNRIARVLTGFGVTKPSEALAAVEAGAEIIDVTGSYILPGFVDAHAHIGFPTHAAFGKTEPAEYVYKLWLAHGVTTIREVGSWNGLSWTVREKRRSADNGITAPRIVAYAYVPLVDPNWSPREKKDPAEWVKSVAKSGADGLKYGVVTPKVFAKTVSTARELGLRTAFHHAQMAVARLDALQSARMGLTSVEHWYGIPEALFEDQTIQRFPLDYNYNNEQHRFGEAGRLWRQATRVNSEHWKKVRDEFIDHDLTLVPTLNIYEASRDLMRARNADWHDEYTWPALWRFFQPNPESHGSYFFNWTTQDEIDWKENYRLWMTFLNDYKNHGGRVAVGSDSGFIFQTYGFGYIRELELLQEAGFHPLEVIRAATLHGAEVCGLAEEIGSIEEGKKADLIILRENPLENFKILYGTGTLRLNGVDGEIESFTGIELVIKDGIVYEPARLLKRVREMVAEQKSSEAGAK
jgi:imidazolonepropionase-like amidohydrolase